MYKNWTLLQKRAYMSRLEADCQCSSWKSQCRRWLAAANDPETWSGSDPEIWSGSDLLLLLLAPGQLPCRRVDWTRPFPVSRRRCTWRRYRAQVACVPLAFSSDWSVSCTLHTPVTSSVTGPTPPPPRQQPSSSSELHSHSAFSSRPTMPCLACSTSRHPTTIVSFAWFHLRPLPNPHLCPAPISAHLNNQQTLSTDYYLLLINSIPSSFQS